MPSEPTSAASKSDYTTETIKAHLPNKIIVDEKGVYWREYDEFRSLCPHSTPPEGTEVVATFGLRREIDTEERNVLEFYSRTHRGLVPDAIQALLASHDAILGIAQALIEAEPGEGGYWETAEQDLRAYVDEATQRKVDER